MEKINPDSVLMITPSEVIEYLFCPRFIFFMNCLNIPQHEELRYKVQKGRNLHERRERENTEYLRKKIGNIDKKISVYLASPSLKVRGVVDEILFFPDGTLSPLDYKYAEYKDFLFQTFKIQSAIYAMLIEETYKKPVNKGYVCYTRGGSNLKEIPYQESDFNNAKEIIDEIFKIIISGYFPKRTSTRNRCPDCCYKNICA